MKTDLNLPFDQFLSTLDGGKLLGSVSRDILGLSFRHGNGNILTANYMTFAGMNTGIQDAHNLAWKIALLLMGTAQHSILNTYETERRLVLYLSFQTLSCHAFLRK